MPLSDGCATHGVMVRRSFVDRCGGTRDAQRSYERQSRQRLRSFGGGPVLFWRRVAYFSSLLFVFAVAKDVSDDITREQRAGSVPGLEDGRVSLARFTKMITSSLHVELAGNEDAFRRVLDHEWEQFFSRPADVRSTFLVCNARGRTNAKRLRDLAGADSLVETLYRRKGEPLCSVVSLDRNTVALVAADGGGRTFSVEPMPHLAKLAPAVAVDPSPSALLLSSEAVDWEQVTDLTYEEGASGDDGWLRRGLRRSWRGVWGSSASGLTAEQRSRVMAEATATRPTTRRLIDDGIRGRVDAIEVTLALHDKQRSKAETEALARHWLSLANDQASLAKVLRENHFWGDGNGVRRRLAKKEKDEDGKRGSSATELRAREHNAHEERKRLGWASLLSAVEKGQGKQAGANRGQRSPASCGFDLARFTVSPSGKKVLLHRPHEVAAAAAERGGGGDGEDDGCLSALLAFLSLQPEVHYVTARRKSATMNIDAAWVTQSGVEGFTPMWDEDLQGQDEIIGVADTGVDMNHCHFREDDGDSVEASEWDDPVTDLSKRKVVQYIDFVDDFDEDGGHGTHVAGSIVGAESGEEAGDGEADGMAFQGKLAVFDFGDSDNNNALTTPDAVDEIMLAPAYDAGARVHSNSWDTVSIEYTSISKEVDEFVYTHQDLLVVFAAGNCGDTSLTDDLVDNCDVLDDDEGTVLSPAQAKNVVAVGASESGNTAGKDVDTVSYFSSKGPTIDGRIKPDIVAPGDPTVSAMADTLGETCDFDAQQGTSMSTPVVAGNAAMARQYFRDGWYNTGSRNLTIGFNPSAALLKAVLVNSATGMEFAGVNPDSGSLDVTLTEPPDTHQGHGRVTMINSLNINSSVGLYFEDWVEISEGETIEYDVSLYEDAKIEKDLRITLVWTDPPASTGSTSALIHDLDLKVIAQSTGVEYYPNGLGEADSVNNVEKVVVTDTTPGEAYTIQVSCDDLSEADTQFFAVIANGEFIKTNALPTAPEPSTWLDLVDKASNIFSVELVVALALGVIVCCSLVCACRSFQRNRKHKQLQSRYRREITANRGVTRNGRKLRPPAGRPQPYPGPLRVPGDFSAADSTGQFQESWRRPGPGSISGRSMRSMRSERSARGALLTGGGAAVPAELVQEFMTPVSPAHETCPECGLRLPDVVMLVKHVEKQHGGRATRRNEAAAVVEAYAKSGGRGKGTGVGSSSNPAKQSLSPSDMQQARQTSGDSRASSRATEASRPSSTSRPTSKSTAAVRGEHASAVRSAAAAGVAVAATASKPRSNSPELSGSGSGRSGSRLSGSGSGSGHAGSSSSKPESKIPDGSVRRPSAEAHRESLPRVKDASRHGKEPLPRILPSVKDLGERGSARNRRRGSVLPTEPAGSTSEPRAAAVSGGVAATASSVAVPATNAGRPRGSGNERVDRKTSPSAPHLANGGELSGSGSGSRASRDRSGRPTDKKSTEERDRGRSRSRSHRHELAQGAGEGFLGDSSRALPREDSMISLTRTASLDRMSAFSSRAITRKSGKINYDNGGDESDDGYGGLRVRTSAADALASGRQLIRRTATTDDLVPANQRLTADRLRMLGSGFPTEHMFSPVMSPKAKAAKGPAYSPVARERAGELDQDRPVSLTRKFFRQLSGEL